MALHKEFIRAWYKWLRTFMPAQNFYSRRIDSPTYRIEHDLDHQWTTVYDLGKCAISQVNWDFHKLSSDEIAELDKTASRLKNCEIDESEKKRFLEYISATRSLLEELSKLPTVSND